MRTLHVIPSIALVRGGPSYVVLQTVKALRDLGVDAEIATTNDNGANSLLDVPLNQKVEYEGVPIYFFSKFIPPNIGLSLNKDKAFIFSISLTLWLWRHIHQYDLVETRYLFSYASTCARLIAQWQNIPYIVHPTGQLASWALSQSRFKKQVYTFFVERKNLNQAAAIQCSSIQEVEDVRNYGVKTLAYTIPVGVDLPNRQIDIKSKIQQQYNLKADVPILLFLSRLHYKKRPDLLIRAVKELATKNYEFYLILAGSGELDYVNNLKKLVSSLSLESHLLFPGFVVGDQKDLILQGSDIFILPSFSENFGVAVAEAMAAELPVIITSGIQISSDVNLAKAGLIVEGEVESLAEAIAQLITSPSLRQEMGRNGAKFVANQYNWKAIASRLVNIYTAIIQKKPLPS